MAEHNITPPPELVQQWIGDYYGCPVSGELSGVETAIAARAAQWGADIELEAYSLVLALMAIEPELFWFSRRHSDGTLCFGDGNWFIVGADLPGAGQISYHLPIDLWPLAEKAGAKQLPEGVPWDGHTSKDVSSRIRLWAESYPSLGHL